MPDKKLQDIAAGSTDDTPIALEEWIAVEPPLLGGRSNSTRDSNKLSYPPPSFKSAQFDVILRRQRQRPRQGGGVKSTSIPSRFRHLQNTLEFAGWGTMSRIELQEPELSQGQNDVQNMRRITLGQFAASAIAGNSILGGVFYTLPAVVAVAGVLSPISLLVSTMIIWLWRPIMEELASALPVNGAPYTYLLNIGSKNLALISAALLLLDYSATAIVSAATAVSYVSGEVHLPFPPIIGTLLILVIFALVGLAGLRESARIASVVLSMHLMTMGTLFVASAVTWGRQGNEQIRLNWHNGIQTLSANDVAHHIFNGICIGVLGLTGFECIPSYASSIRHGCYPKVLRNLHFSAIIVDVVAMLLVLALVPLNTVLSGGNVLSILAETATGKWLRIITVVDAVIVLCGGVLNGILSACELFERLARDRLLPQVFRRRLPITDAPFYSILAFFTFSFALYAISGANLGIVSKMFSLIWLAVMALLPLAALLLKFNRGRLPRRTRAPLLEVLFTLAVVSVMIGGNIAIDPTIVGYAAAYFIVIAAAFYGTMKASRLVHTVLWLYDQSKCVRGFSWAESWGVRLTTAMSHLRRQPVCILVKSDEINILFHELLYVSQNEETSCLKLVHFYDEEYGIPSEMEANWKILDEAFPEITVDLVLVKGEFTPTNVAALARRFNIPTTLMFMSCPGPHLSFPVADFGTRIISL